MISILFLGKYIGEIQYNFLNNSINNFFVKSGVQTKMILFVAEKKLPGNLEHSETITFLSKQDLDFFKKWKSQIAQQELNEEYDLLISTLFDSTKYFDSFIENSKAKLKLGISGSSKVPFDISIIQNTEDIEAYFKKCKKYLSKLR